MVHEIELTENIRTRSPVGRMFLSSLSIAMSFDEDATMCSPRVYGWGIASSSR